MRQKKRYFNPYGMRARLGLSLLFSMIWCVFLFLVLNTGLDYLLMNYYEHSDFERIQQERQYDSLQDYIDANHVSSQDLQKLKKWEKKQPVILLELYEEDNCIYSSLYDAPVSSLVLNEGMENRDHICLRLADKEATAFIYSDFTYQLGFIITAISIVSALILFILLFLYNSNRLIRYICRLNEEVQILEGGNLEYCVSEEGNDEITDLARSMNRMRTTLQQQIETEQQLHQANRQLITEMSHDLRTPLTGIMLYLEVLRSQHYESEEQLQDYLAKIDAKAHHMKLLSDHLFEYTIQEPKSKQVEPLPMETALGQALETMVDDLNARDYKVETDLEWRNCFVQVNSEYIHRIFENIVSNIEKYGEKSATVRIDTLYNGQYCGLAVMNTFAERASLVESNGVGIESIRSMMKEMKGILCVERTDITFEMTLLFPVQ